MGEEGSAAVETVVPHGSNGSDTGTGSLQVRSGSGRGMSTKGEERFRIGGRNAKLVRQEELRTQALRSMAESAKRKSDALEEQNAIAVFSRQDAASLPDSAQFFEALRRTYLAQALKRARHSQLEVEHMTPGSEVTQAAPPVAYNDGPADGNASNAQRAVARTNLRNVAEPQ